MTTSSLGRALPFATRSVAAQRYLIVAAWCAIALGIILRFGQLPSRTVYFDEAYTQMRVSGHTDSEMGQALYDGHARPAAVVRRYATVDATSSASRLVASLIKEDAQHPPLFYVAELFVIKLLGDSLLAWRLLPAVFGVVAIGAAYALARTLFVDRTAGLLAAALFALSPIERIYSDQAREYSLLVLVVLLATLALVRALRTPTLGPWLGYAGLLIAGLYTSPFMGYVIAAHIVFAVGVALRTQRVVLLAFAGAVTGALVAYGPWLYVILTHRADIARTNTWSAERWPPARLAAKWIFNTGTSFFDLEYLNLRWAIVFAAVALLVLFAIVQAVRTMSVEARWCLGAGIVIPALLLAGPDIVLSEHRSSVARYALPALALLPIVTARGLVGRPLVATFVLAAALCSSAVGALHASWWDNDRNADDARIAALIDVVPHAQVVSEIPPGYVVTFARLLDPDIHMILSVDLKNVVVAPTDPLFVMLSVPADVAAFGRRTGIALARVPFVPTLTAHEIGAHIAGGAAHTEGDIEIYRAVAVPRSRR